MTKRDPDPDHWGSADGRNSWRSADDLDAVHDREAERVPVWQWVFFTMVAMAAACVIAGFWP